MGYKIKVGGPVEIIQQGGETAALVKHPYLFPEPISCSSSPPMTPVAGASAALF